MRQQVKLLLLGAGASGKSTVLKQMRLINNVEFTPQEVECESAVLLSSVRAIKLGITDYKGRVID